MAKYLRKVGRDKIMERIAAIENNEYVPTDILSQILEGFSNINDLIINNFQTYLISIIIYRG